MAIAIGLALFFGAIFNAGAFAATHYIEKATDDDSGNYDDSETKRHNLATEKYDSDSEKYRENRDKLEKWENEQEKEKEDAEISFQKINKSLKLYSFIKKKKKKKEKKKNQILLTIINQVKIRKKMNYFFMFSRNCNFIWD